MYLKGNNWKIERDIEQMNLKRIPFCFLFLLFFISNVLFIFSFRLLLCFPFFSFPFSSLHHTIIRLSPRKDLTQPLPLLPPPPLHLHITFYTIRSKNIHPHLSQPLPPLSVHPPLCTEADIAEGASHITLGGKGRGEVKFFFSFFFLFFFFFFLNL